MAEKTENYQKGKSPAECWIKARSKKYAGHTYFFNTATGRAVWDLSKANLLKAKENDSFPAGKIPEPSEPPLQCREIEKNKIYDCASVRPRVYNKQIINNGYPKPCIFSPFMPLFPAQEMAMPLQYNQNVWAVPPQQQFYVAPLPIQPSPFASPFTNPFNNVNQFPNSTTSNDFNVPRERAVFADANTSALPEQEIDVRALHRSAGSTLSDKFTNLNNSRRSDEIVERNLPRVTIQNGIQDLRQLIIAKRSRNNSVCSGSLDGVTGHENKNSYEQEITTEYIGDQLRKQHIVAKRGRNNSVCSESLESQTSHENKHGYDQESTTDDIKDQLEELNVNESPKQDSIVNSVSSLDDEDDKWLSDNMQLRGTKAVIDVEPLQHILGIPEEVWYLIPDADVLLSNLTFINVLINSDEQCRMVIPRGIYEALQVKARGGHKGAMGVRARNACRLVAQLVKSKQAFIDHQEESGAHDANSFKNSCSRLLEMKMPFVALSNDSEKLAKIKEIYPVAFTVEEVKECLTSQQTYIENKISDPPMTITISNNTSQKTLAAKNKKTKLFYSPKTNTNETSIETIGNEQEPNVLNQLETVPTTSRNKVDSEIQVTLTSPKKMVNAEVQTDLLLIDKQPVFESPENVTPKNTVTTAKPAPITVNTNKEATVSITNDNDNSTVKRRELKLRRNPVVQTSSNANTPKSSQLEKKSKWWRRKRVDLPIPVTSELVTEDTIQVPEKKTVQTDSGTDTPDAVVASPKHDITKTIIRPSKMVVNTIQTRAKTRSQETKPESNPYKPTGTATNKRKTEKPETAPPKVVIDPGDKIANLPETTPESNPVIFTRTTRAKAVTQPIIAPPKMVVNNIQYKEQSGNNEPIVKTAETETELASNPLKSPRTAMPLDKVVLEKTKMTQNTQTGIIRKIFSPQRDAYKSPESNVQSPKKMKDMSPEIGIQKNIEESVFSSDIVSGTRSSACSEKSIILNLTQSSNLRSKHSSSTKQLFEKTDDATEESLKNCSDEWILHFVQIMEEVLSQVLQLDPNSEHAISPPWTMIESTECIKNKYTLDIGIKTTATEFLAVVIKVLDNDRGHIRRDLTISKFLEIFSYAVNFLLKLQQKLPTCEDIMIGLNLLYQLLNDIENYNNEPVEFTDNDAFEASCNISTLEENDGDKGRKEVTNGEKLPDKLSTPTRQTDQAEANLPQVTFIRKFNKSESFEKLLQKRNQKLSPRPEITYNSKCNQAQMKLQDSPKIIKPNDSPKTLNKSTSSKSSPKEVRNDVMISNFALGSFDFRNTKKQTLQKVDSPVCTAPLHRQITNSPPQNNQEIPYKGTEPIGPAKTHQMSPKVYDKNFNTYALEIPYKGTEPIGPPKSHQMSPKVYDKNFKTNALDMDVLDYSENYIDYIDDELDYVDDNLNFVSKDNDFNGSVDFEDYNRNNMDYNNADNLEYTININKQDSFNKVNANRNMNDTSKEAIDSNAQLIVNKFLKEMKQTFLHYNSFCEQTYKEMREISKLTTIRQMELHEQAEEAKFHINNLRNTLNSISNRERNGPESSLQAIFRRCNGIQLTYRDIIEKCSTQAQILFDALAAICEMLELALK